MYTLPDMQLTNQQTFSQVPFEVDITAISCKIDDSVEQPTMFRIANQIKPANRFGHQVKHVNQVVAEHLSYFLHGSNQKTVQWLINHKIDDIFNDIFGENVPQEEQDISYLFERYIRKCFLKGMSRLYFESNLEIHVLRETDLQERLLFEIDVMKSPVINGDALA